VALGCEHPASPERRGFLRMAAGGALAWLAPGAALGARGSRPVLVCVNLTGGLDGSSVLVPYGEDAYYRARPHIAVPPPGKPDGALPLVDGFGLHPKLEPLYQLYLAQELAIVPAAGGAHLGRSHFAARDAMHRASASDTASANVRDGWANRYASLRSEVDTTPRLFSTTPELPMALAGEAPAEMTAGPYDLSRGEHDAAYLDALERLYQGSTDPFARAASRAVDLAEQLRSKTRRVRLGQRYSDAGRGLGEAARLIVANVGAEIIWVEISGFDTHRAQGASHGQLANKLARLGRDLFAFRQDVKSAFSDVTLVTLTEFGRTLAETGAGGTDHGAASCMLVMGGRVRGGRLVGSWPGLDRASLHEGRELTVTTDYRAVLTEVLELHLGLDPSVRGAVFPGFAAEPLGLYAEGG
jgi:uncharacterized protein (DUF1501 family)